MSRSVNDNRLRVARLNAAYFVARDHPAPDRLKRKLDDTLQKDLAEVLSTAMLRSFSSTDESVWCIRRLDVNLDINAGWNRDRLANSWANEIDRSLTVNLKSDADSQNVIRFSTRAAYLAAFLNDLANSNATGKWYYQYFDGLRLLPLSASLRTAICDDANEGLRTLLHLDNYQLKAVLGALSSRDAQRVLDHLTELGETSNEGSCLRLLLNVCREARTDHLETLEERNHILGLCLAVCRTQVELMSPTLSRVAAALVRLRSLLENADADGRKRLVAAVISKDLSTLYLYAGSVDAEVLLPLTRCPTEQLDELALILLKPRTEVAPASETTGPRYTQFGGVFLLLPILDRMPIDEATDSWPTLSGTTAASIVRFVVVMHCCGRTRAPMFFADALMRDLMNIPPTLSSEKLIEWQKELTAQHLQSFNRRLNQVKTRIAKDAGYLSLGNAFRFSRSFARSMRVAAQNLLRNFALNLPGFSTSGLEYIYTNFLDFSATLEDEPTRRVITLGRPPLNLILNMSGLNRGSYQLSFTGERAFALFEQG